MLKLFALVLALLAFSEAQNPGVKVAISQDGLNYAARKAVDIMSSKVAGIRLPDFSKSNYKIEDMRITRFIKPYASIRLNPNQGLTAVLRRGEVRVDGRWEIKLWFIRLKGNIYASSTDINLSLGVGIKAENGRPKMNAGACNTKLGGFKVKTSGSILSWLINIIIRLFNSTIRKKVEGIVCDKLKDVVNKNANDELATLNLIAKITDDVQLNYFLTQNPVFTSNYMSSSHRGQFLYDPLITPTPVEMGFVFGRMVSTSISSDTLNSLGRVAHAKDLIKYEFKINDELFKKLLKIEEVGDFELILHLSSSKAPSVLIETKKLTLIAGVSLKFFAPGFVLELKVDLKADTTVSITGDRVKGALTKLETEITIVQNNLGQPLNQDELNKIVNSLIPTILPEINKILDKGIPIPRIENVRLSNYILNLLPGYIGLAYNIEATV